MTRPKCNLGWAQDVPMLSDDEFAKVMDELSSFKRKAMRSERSLVVLSLQR